MISKINLFILSLWLLFLCVAIITAQIPLCFSDHCRFIGVWDLLSRNITSTIAICLATYGIYSYIDFNYKTSGSPHLALKVLTREPQNYKHLVFLATYIIPLTSVNFGNERYLVVFWILIIVMGAIYVKTDLFFANPSLSLLGYKLFRIDAQFKGNIPDKKVVIISKDEVNVGDKLTYYKLSETVFMARKVVQ